MLTTRAQGASVRISPVGAAAPARVLARAAPKQQQRQRQRARLAAAAAEGGSSAAPAAQPKAAPLTPQEEEERFHEAYAKVWAGGGCSMGLALAALVARAGGAGDARPLPAAAALLTARNNKASGGSALFSPRCPSQDPITYKNTLQHTPKQAFTISQLYNLNRPPPVPLTEYEERRRRRDLEEILGVSND